MIKLTLKFLLVSLLGLGLLSPLAVADIVDMKLTNVGPNHLGGVYIGPYTATINGVSTPVICDDFNAVTRVNETWKATVHSFSDLTGTKFFNGANEQQYFQVAWLSMQLLKPNVPCAPGSVNCPGEIQYAVWEVFAPGVINAKLTGAAKTAAQWWYNEATTKTYSADQFSAMRILTPVSGTAMLNGRSMPDPQEFIVRVPEPSLIGLLAMNILGLAGLALLRRRGVIRL